MTDSMDRRIKRPWWAEPRLRLGAGAAAVVVALAAMAVVVSGTAQRSVRVPAAGLTIEPVRQDVFHDFTAIQGQVAPHDTLYLDALVGGQVQQLFVQAGDRVKAGQPLIRFHNPDVELDVLNREAIASQSISQAQTLQNQLETIHAANERSLEQIDYDIVRLRRALDRRQPYAEAFPQEQLDQYKDELEFDLKQRPVQAEANKRQEALRVAQMPQIQASLATLQQNMTAVRARLNDLTVKAPATGRITVLDLKIGQNQKPGDRLAELVPDTGFKVSADIDEFYLPRLRTGQIATADFDGRTRQLRVQRIYPQVKNGVFTVDMDFVGPAPTGLIPGAAVQGKLALGDDRPALILSAGAFLEASGGDWVFVVAPDGRSAQRRRVKIGRRNADQVEVLSGLKAGDRVVTSDYAGYEKIDRLDIQT